MFLSDADIELALNQKHIQVDPPVKPEDIQSVGIRVHLASEICVPTAGQRIDPRRKQPVDHTKHTLSEDHPYVLKPGGFVLGATMERIRTVPHILCFLDTRSTLARYGLPCHMGSMVVNGTWDQAICIVLELANLGPFEIELTPNMPVGMLYFGRLTWPVSEARQGNAYPGQSKPIFPGPQTEPQAPTTPPDDSSKKPNDS